MEQYQDTFNAIHASEIFKRRMVNLMSEHNAPRAPRTGQQARRSTIPAKRRALLITIAAVLLLLSACAAYAIYWSSTQRAMQDAVAQVEKPADDLQREAEAYADGMVKASSLTAALSGSAKIGDITLQLVSVEVFQDIDGAEYVFHFSLSSEQIGFITRFDPTWLEEDRSAQERLQQYDSFCEIGIDARDFVLTIDGQAFQPYAQPDYEGIRQPASGWNEPDESSAGTSSFMIRQNPVPITQDSQMNLSGTLYSCDASGTRTGTIGSFSIGFAYEYPAAQAEEIRQASIDSYIKSHQATNAARLISLGTLPEEATPIGLTQDIVTLNDVAVLEDGLLLGSTDDRGWQPADGTKFDVWKAGQKLFYLDGYQIPPEVMDISWSEEKLAEPDQFGEYSSRFRTDLLKLPYYRALQDMPEELVVYITREKLYYSNSENKLIERPYYYPLNLIFRVNRTTGAVTLPKDDAEKASWIAEQNALASDGRNDARDYIIHQELTIGGMTVLLERLLYYPDQKRFVLHAFIPVIDCEVMPWEIDPVVSIDGVQLAEPLNDTYYRTLDPSTPAPFQTNIEEWIETYGLDPNRFSWYDFTYTAPKSIIDMPETFTLRFTWDVYDLVNGNRAFIGTFAFEVPIQKENFLAFDSLNRDYEYVWKRAIIADYGIHN